MHRKLLLLVLTTAASFGIAATTMAETTSEDAYDYRVAIMTTLKGHLVASSMIVRGLIEDTGQLAEHANSIANSLAEFDHVFPEGSNVGDSEALDAVWTDPEKFAEAYANAKAASAEFAAAANSGDMEAAGAAFRKVGGSCRGCHDDFKKQDD